MMLLRGPLLLAQLLIQSTFLALGQIRTHKTRAALTTVGIVIGVASVSTVIAVLTGFKEHVLSQFEAFGTNKLYIVPSRPDKGSLRQAPWHLIRFTPDQFDDIKRHCPSVEEITRVGFMNQTIQFRDRSVEGVRVLAIDPAWHRIENRYVELGRPFSVIDKDQARPVCLLTPKARDKLRLDRDCIGQEILIGSRLFRIVGIVEPHLESGMFSQGESDVEACIPFMTAWKMAQPWMLVIATSKSTDLSQEAQAEIRFFLRRVRRLKPGDPDTFRVEVLEKYLSQFKQIALVITIVASGIVGISLLVGGVGIMNIMLVSVSERTREIGLRKAVGARPSAVLLQFLVEAVVLCLLGGLVGLLVAHGFTTLITHIIKASIPDAEHYHAYIPGWALVLSFGFSAGVGIVFGMFPAIKAARLDPIEALRHE